MWALLQHCLVISLFLQVQSSGGEVKPDKCSDHDDNDGTNKELEQSPLLIQDDEN